MMRKFGLIYLVTWLSKILGIVSLFLYAKYLTPENLGIATVVILIASFTEVFTQSGTVNYILAKENLNNKDINTCFTVNLILRIIASIVLVFFSTLISKLFNLSIESEIQFVAAFIAIRGLENIYVTVQKRKGDFDTFSKISLITRLTSFFITSIGVIILQNHWPIIFGLGIYHLIFVLLSYTRLSIIPKLSLQNITEQLDFAKWIMLKGYFGFFRSKMDDLFVATNFTADQIGSFGLAKEISMLKYEQITQPLLEPLLSSYRCNLDNASVFFKAYMILSITVLPICFFLSFHSHEIILFFLGSKWVNTADYIVYLAYLSYTTSIASLYATACNAALQSKKIFNADLATFFISFLIIYVFFIELSYNIAFVRLVAGVLTLIFFVVYFDRFVKAKISEIFIIFFILILNCIISNFFSSFVQINILIQSFIFYLVFLVVSYFIYFTCRNTSLYLNFGFSRALSSLESELQSFVKSRKL